MFYFTVHSNSAHRPLRVIIHATLRIARLAASHPLIYVLTDSGYPLVVVLLDNSLHVYLQFIF